MPQLQTPAAWASLIDRLAATHWQRLIVIGAPDRGKSTFCRLLLEKLQANGTSAFLLDTALAEKLMGPPACLTLGALDGDSIKSQAQYFIGGLDASKRMAPMLAGVAKLANEAARDARLVIDTGNCVHSVGRRLKRLKIDALQPDIIVALGLDAELEPLLATCPQDRVYRLPTHEAAKPRNAMARALERLEAFRAVFAGARTIALEDLVIEPWDADAFEGLDGEFLCGLADAEGRELGLGILTSADIDKGTAQVFTTVAPEAVAPNTIRRLRIGMAFSEELRDLLEP